MLRNTQKIREMYEDIQRKLFYMIPEKWDKLYLYSSVIEQLAKVETGELFFYYIPKGILRKNPINVYEIPSKFNIEEANYLKLVELLYGSIKKLREEFRKTGQELWSDLTISIENMKFKVEYGYENLQNSRYDSYERHIIWRYKYLNLEIEHLPKEERKILKRYLEEKDMYEENNKEVYEEGIYIKDIKNMVDFNTDINEDVQNVEYVASKGNKINKNQILRF